MNFTIRQIEVFYCVAKHLSLTKAANLLNLTPPAVSKQIKNLEIECNNPLFTLVGRQLYLTKFGEGLFHQIIPFLEAAKNLKTNISCMAFGKNTSIKISIGNTFQTIIFPLITEFSRKHPNINLEISVPNWSDQHKQLKEKVFSSFIIADPKIYPANYKKETLKNFKFVLVANPNNRLAWQEVTLNELREEIFLSGSSSSSSQEIQDRFFKRWQINKPPIRLDSYASVLQAVKASLGIALLPNLIVEEDIREGKLAEIKFAFQSPFFPIVCLTAEKLLNEPEVAVWRQFICSKFS